MANKTKILVTGSLGVIGTGLVKELESRGNDVFGIDLYHSRGETGWEHRMENIEKPNYSRCDVSDYRQLERVFKKYGPFDYVFHLAAEFGRWNGEDFYEQVWKSNAIGTKNMIRLQEKYDFKMIFTSSSEVYGDYPDIMEEEVMNNKEVKQLNDYALSKWVSEQQILNSYTQHGTETVIIRYFNTGGKGETYHSYRSVNAKFCYNLLMGRPITVYTGHKRTSLAVEDAVRTTANIIDNFKTGEVYNIGGKEHHTIERLAELAIKHTGADPSLLILTESEILTTMDKKVDTSKAERDLNHKITLGLEEQVKQTVDWMKEYYK